MLTIFCFLFLFNGDVPKYPLPKAAIERANEIIRMEFSAYSGFRLQPVSLTTFNSSRAGFEVLQNQILRVETENSTLGYVYFGKSVVFEKTFHFMVILQPDLSIRLLRLLLYEDEYGAMIADEGWLDKAKGHSSRKPVVYGQSIDAVTGATVSGKALVNETNKMLRNASSLREARIL
jgi:hypothetical protein